MSNVDVTFYITCSDDLRDSMQKLYGLQNWYSFKNQKKPDSYVWDEDKTVRENKAMTAAHNAAIDEEIQRRQECYRQACVKFEEAVIEYIIEELRYDNVKCSKEHAKAIWNFCQHQWEDDPHNYINDVISFYVNLMS